MRRFLRLFATAALALVGASASAGVVQIYVVAPTAAFPVTAGEALYQYNYDCSTSPTAGCSPMVELSSGGSALGTGGTGTGLTVNVGGTVVLGAGSATIGTVTLGAGSSTVGAITQGNAGSAGSGWYVQPGTGASFVMVGAGTAGTPTGGVVSMQGVPGGQPVPISGTVSASIGNFAPTPAYGSISATTSSSRASAPTGTSVIVYNTGTVDAYVIPGNGSIVATTADDVVKAGGWMQFTMGANTNIAAITASGSTTLTLSGGSGIAAGSTGTSSSGGGTVTQGNAGSVGQAWYTTLTEGGSVISSGNGAHVQPAAGALWASNLYMGGAVASATNPVPVASFDAAPATQTITAADVASSTTTWTNSQKVFTGTPTAGSAASFALNGMQTVAIQVTGSATGALETEVSADGGVTWVARGVFQFGANPNASSLFGATGATPNLLGEMNVGGFTNLRVRALNSSTWAGTATVAVNETTLTVQQVHVTGTNLSSDPCGTTTWTQTALAISTANAYQNIAGVSGKRIYVCYLISLAGAADNVAFVEGTGSNCGTGTAAVIGSTANLGTTVSGGFNFGANGGGFPPPPPGHAMFSTQTAGDSLCMTQSSAGPLSGVMQYVIQ